MSWNIGATYTCICLPAVRDALGLKALLKEFAASILPTLLAEEDHDLWDAFDAIREDLEDATQDHDAVTALVNQIELYLSDITYEDDCISLVVGSEYDSEHDCRALVEALATFLLPHASNPYLLLCSAAFDNGGGYANQSVLYSSGDTLVSESTYSLLERLVSNPDATVRCLLPFTMPTHQNTAEPLAPHLSK